MKKFCILLLAVFLISGCSSAQKDVEKYTSQLTDVGFDTFVSLIIYTDSEETFKTYENKVIENFNFYNQLFDKYNDYTGINNIKTINDKAGIEPVKVDENIIELIKMSKEYSDKTHNQFDITMGPVLEIWHAYRDAGTIANNNGEESTIPTVEELEIAKTCVGWDNVEINEENQTVYLKTAGASLDVGSVAKGYATEKTAQDLEAMGVTSAILNAGGNVRIIGSKPDESDWNVGVQVPNIATYSTDSLATISLPNTSSFVTSGDYQRYYMYEDKMLHHIIDPQTLFPANHFRSVTVIDSKSSATADILSTSLFTLTYEEGKALIDSLNADEQHLNAIWVFDDTTAIPDNVETMKSGDYTIIATDGIRDKITIK